MRLKYGSYDLDVDVRRTREFYEKAETVGESCGCDGCVNFEKAANVLPAEIKDFFGSLGVNLRKASECYVIHTDEDGKLVYGGFYHICGVLLSGEGAWVKVSENTAAWDQKRTFAVNEDFLIFFQKEIDLLEEGFPQPVIQMEFSARIPWMMDKDNPYM